MTERSNTKYKAKPRSQPGAPQPEEIAAVRNLDPQIANLRSNIGLLGKAFNVRTQTGFRFAHIVLSLRQHLDRLRNDDDGTGECDRRPGGKYVLPACLLRKFRSDQSSLNNRKKAMPKILIVDDNRLHLACATYSLRKHFLPENVFIATNGREALEIMEHVVIDAIFLDTDMPTMNGLEMADVVRHVETQLGQREFKTLIVAMLTPTQARDEDFLTDCLVAGMDRFCVKPLSVHMYAILDAVTVSGSAVEGFRRKALELQWVSRHPELQQTLFGKQKADAKNMNRQQRMIHNKSNDDDNDDDPFSSKEAGATSASKPGGRKSNSTSPRRQQNQPTITFFEESQNTSAGDETQQQQQSSSSSKIDANSLRLTTQFLSSDPEDIKRAQETALTLAPDLHDERQILQLVEKDQRFAVEDIFARERREDTERMQHATALLRDRIADLERQLAAATGQKQKTMDSLHVETIAKLEKQAEDQRLQIMKLSVRNRELTKRNEKLEDDMRQIIRHGANNARTLRTAFRFIGQVQKKMEKYEQHSMEMEDRSANLSWQNFYGKHFQGTASRRQIEMPEAAEDYSSSWYHEQLDESHRITSRSNETCASAVVMLGELLEHVHLVRPSMFGSAVVSPMASQTSFPLVQQQQQQQQSEQQSGTSTPSAAGTSISQQPFNNAVATASASDDIILLSSGLNTARLSPANSQAAFNPNASLNNSVAASEQSAWKTLQRDIETVIHSLSTMLMQNVKDLTEGTKRNAANICVRELALWKRLARFDKEQDGSWMDLAPKVQDEIHSIVQRMEWTANAKQRRSNETQTASFEAPPWVDSDFANGSEFASSLSQQQKISRSGSFGGGSEMSFMTEVSLASKQTTARKDMVAAAANAKEWTFTGLLNKLRPIMSFEGFVPLEVRQKAFEKIVSSVFRLERKQTTDLGDATKRLIKEVRHHYNNVCEDGDEKQRVLLLGDVASRSTLHFREIMKILVNVSDNIGGVVDAVIVHTLKSIEPNSANTRATKERGLALALLEALECADHDPPLTTPWGEPALIHKIRAGETWESLEKAFGCSLVEMKRMNASADPPINFDDGALPEPGQILKLPSRADYIRGKFAHLYHPKTTFSKSGAGERSRLQKESHHQHANNRTGSRMHREGTLNPNMFARPERGSGYLNVHGGGGPGFGRHSTMKMSTTGGLGGGRSSTMMGGRMSTMKSGGPSRGPSRMVSTRAPSQMIGKLGSKRRGSFVGQTISHYNRQENKVGATNRERVNARVAQSILNQSRNNAKSTYSPASSPTHSALKKSNSNSMNPPSSNEITVPIPSSASPDLNKTSTTKDLLNNLFDPDNNNNKSQESFNVTVKVLPTEAPKSLAEIAEEYGVTEEDIRNANPHLKKIQQQQNSLENTRNNLDNDDDDDNDNTLLQTDDELTIPAKKEFVVKSLQEARDSQISEAIKKYLESNAAKAEAEAAEANTKNDGDNNNNNNNNTGGVVRSEESLAERMEKSKMKTLAAATAAMESQEAADHAAALHRALIEHLHQLREDEDADENNTSNSKSDQMSLQSGATSPLNPFSGIRGDSLRKTKHTNVVVDMPVKEATSFEKLAVLYGIRGEDLVQANPSLSNPIAAGEVLKVPVNILEWRERVAKAAQDAQSAAEIGIGVQKVDSMIIPHQADDDGVDLNSVAGELGGGDGDHLGASVMNLVGGLPGLNSQSGTNMLAALLAEGKENSWTRAEKALFTAVSTALKQKSLTVVLTHQETEYGVTIETIAEEYGCGEIAFVDAKFNNNNNIHRGSSSVVNDDEQQQHQTSSNNPSVKNTNSDVRKNSSSVASASLQNNINNNSNNNSNSISGNLLSNEEDASQKSGAFSISHINLKDSPESSGAHYNNNKDENNNNKPRHSIISSDNSTQLRQEKNEALLKKEKAHQQLYTAERNKAIQAAAKEIEQHNVDNGAIIHDDDDDNSVNPNVPLRVPVPLEAIIRKEIDFTMDLQEQAMELAHALRRHQQQEQNDDEHGLGVEDESHQSETPEEVHIPSNPLRAENSLSQFTIGDNKSQSQKEGRTSSFHQKATKSRSDSVIKIDEHSLAELCQLEDLVSRHQACINTMLEIYFEKTREKLMKPETSEVSTITDNISNILLSTIRRDSAFAHPTKQRSSKVVFDPELLEKESILLKEHEDERQLAAAAVLLGVDDISKVPAALRNGGFSLAATNFLDRLKKTYPMASSAFDKNNVKSSGYGKKSINTKNNTDNDLSGSSSQLYSTSSPLMNTNSNHQPHLYQPSPSQKMLGMTNIDGLKIVGNKAGKYDPDDDLRNYTAGGRKKSSAGGGRMLDENNMLRASFLAGYSGNGNDLGIGGGGGGMSIIGGGQQQQQKKKPMGLRGSQSARLISANDRFFSGSSKFGKSNNFFDEKDLLRQRMERLGFKTSAEGLAGDSEVVAKFQNNIGRLDASDSLLQDSMKIIGSPTKNNSNSTKDAGFESRSHQHHSPQTPQFLALDEEEERTNRYEMSNVIQRAANHFANSGFSPRSNNHHPPSSPGARAQVTHSTQLWGGSSTITGIDSSAKKGYVSSSAMSKSTPILPRGGGVSNNSKITPLPTKQKFHQEDVFDGSTNNKNNNDDDQQQQQQQENSTNNNNTQLSPAPPSMSSKQHSNSYTRSGILSKSQSPRVKSTAMMSQSLFGSSSVKSKIGTGDRKVEMYAEDRKGAIERFTERLMEIANEDPAKSMKTSTSPHKTKFVSSPTSLAGGASTGGAFGKSANLGGQSTRK